MKISRIATAAIIAVVLIFSSIPILGTANAGMKPVYVVTASSVNIRSGIGTSYASLGILSKGEELMLLDKSGSWYKVRTRDRITGYVAPSYIKYIRDEQETTFGTIASSVLPEGVGPGDIYEVTADSVTLRKAATTSAAIVVKQTRGSLLTCLEKLTHGWMKVRTVSGVVAYTGVAGTRFVGRAVDNTSVTPTSTATPKPTPTPSAASTNTPAPSASVSPSASPTASPTPGVTVVCAAAPSATPTYVITEVDTSTSSGLPVVPDWNDDMFTIDASYQKYAYDTMFEDLSALARAYPESVRVYTIGETVWGLPIPVVQVGNPNASEAILVHASIHAREYMTTQVVMRQIEYYAANLNASYNGTSFKEILDRVCIWFVPMANPDGVYLSQNGVAEMQDLTKKQSLIRMNKGSADFTKWKANGRGVDLNQNFDANWRLGAVTGPAAENYAGVAAQSEPESDMLVWLTKEIDAKMSISYHSRGSYMYWYYGQTGDNKTRDYKLATELSKLTGYWLMPESGSMGGRGYKDWFVKELERPGFTIEIGSSKTEAPQPIDEFPDVWKRNALTSIHLAWRCITGQ